PTRPDARRIGQEYQRRRDVADHAVEIDDTTGAGGNLTDIGTEGRAGLFGIICAHELPVPRRSRFETAERPTTKRSAPYGASRWNRRALRPTSGSCTTAWVRSRFLPGPCGAPRPN